MVRGEATVRDWLKSQRVKTSRVARPRLADLVTIVRDNRLTTPPRSRPACTAPLGHRRDERAIFPDRYPSSYLDERSRHAPCAMARLEGLTALQQDILVRVIFLLNSVAGLDKKQQLQIGIIYTEPRLTAGDTLGAFGGFFHRDWREHDYRLGRRAARARLPSLLSLDAPPPLEPGFEHEYEIPPAWEGFKNATLRDADTAPRIALRDMLARRAGFVGPSRSTAWLRWSPAPPHGRGPAR